MDLEIPDFIWDQPGVTLPRRKDEIELRTACDVACDVPGVTPPAYKKRFTNRR